MRQDCYRSIRWFEADLRQGPQKKPRGIKGSKSTPPTRKTDVWGTRSILTLLSPIKGGIFSRTMPNASEKRIMHRRPGCPPLTRGANFCGAYGAGWSGELTQYGGAKVRSQKGEGRPPTRLDSGLGQGPTFLTKHVAPGSAPTKEKSKTAPLKPKGAAPGGARRDSSPRLRPSGRKLRALLRMTAGARAWRFITGVEGSAQRVLFVVLYGEGAA